MPTAELELELRTTLVSLIQEQLMSMNSAELLRLIGRLDAAGYWH